MSISKRRLTVAASSAAAILAAGGIATAVTTVSNSQQVKSQAFDAQAKNVILLIGDGTSDSELTVARNYQYGANGRLPGLDDFIFTGNKTTHSVTESGASDYDPESASTATAWSTGEKTTDGRISTLPGNNTPSTADDPRTIMELAQARGFRTGNVTTSRLTDATPAGPMAHITARGCEGPQNLAACTGYAKSAGGPGSISEQSIDLGVDFLMGGGKNRYDATTSEAGSTRTVTDVAVSKGYDVVRSKADLAGIGQLARGEKILGLMDDNTTNDGHLEVEWTGIPATNPSSGGTGGQTCIESNPDRPSDEPDLVDMTNAALTALDTGAGLNSRRPGFFLQVEGSSIDKRAHGAQPCEQIGETLAFDEAVRAALDFASTRNDTLVIVTGDHAHSTQIVENNSTPPGCSSKLLTKEGAVMHVTYGTNLPCPTPGANPATDRPTGGASQQHTGAQIRIAAFGPRASRFLGLTDDTDTFDIMNGALQRTAGQP